MSLMSISKRLRNAPEPIVLIFAFNASGKTRLSVAYKDATKSSKGVHAGVYFNAYSEDLFWWDNDEDNDNANMRLMVRPSSLNKLFPSVTEAQIKGHLAKYLPKYDFIFDTDNDNPQNNIPAIIFLEEGTDNRIKVSRGEEKIFVWCFFLALFETPGWADVQSDHVFIDDPVSSLDDHNLFVTASSICELITEHHTSKKIIITTHHFGLFMAIHEFLKRGEEAASFHKKVLTYVLADRGDGPKLKPFRKSPVLSHLRALQELEDLASRDRLAPHHFMLLRQTLETTASFLGSARVSHVIEQIGLDSPASVTQQINALSHKTIFKYEPEQIAEPDKVLMTKIIRGLKDKYDFVTHA